MLQSLPRPDIVHRALYIHGIWSYQIYSAIFQLEHEPDMIFCWLLKIFQSFTCCSAKTWCIFFKKKPQTTLYAPLTLIPRYPKVQVWGGRALFRVFKSLRPFKPSGHNSCVRLRVNCCSKIRMTNLKRLSPGCLFAYLLVCSQFVDIIEGPFGNFLGPNNVCAWSQSGGCQIEIQFSRPKVFFALAERTIFWTK